MSQYQTVLILSGSLKNDARAVLVSLERSPPLWLWSVHLPVFSPPVMKFILAPKGTPDVTMSVNVTSLSRALELHFWGHFKPTSSTIQRWLTESSNLCLSDLKLTLKLSLGLFPTKSNIRSLKKPQTWAMSSSKFKTTSTVLNSSDSVCSKVICSYWKWKLV